MIQYLFVINKGSGNNNGIDWQKTISDFLDTQNKTFEIYFLPDCFTLNQIKDHIYTTNPKTVVAVGGDGTVTMLANILVGTNMSLGILPNGSANGMAKELDISENVSEALQILIQCQPKLTDLIQINNKEYCLHLSDIGLNAQLIKHFSAGKLRGKLGYALVLLKTLLRKQKMIVTVQTDTVQIKRTAFMVVLANATKYGTGAVINPNGKLNDGLFEVIILKKLSLLALLKMIFNPGLFNAEAIEIVSCTQVEISTKRKVHFQIDGEYIGKLNNIKATIKPNAIHVILPTACS